jgi:uncharacterized protein YbdZ (MbtH family)
MTTNPFEDESAACLVLVNDLNQHSLWPACLDAPAGWRVALPASSRADCMTYVEANWTDLRPAARPRTT